MTPIELQPCGCCGFYHHPTYAGDCRNDAERFPVQCVPYGDFPMTTREHAQVEALRQRLAHREQINEKGR